MASVHLWKSKFLLWFGLVCWGLTSLLNIWGHITTVPACSSSTLTNVLPHMNAIMQTQDMTPYSVMVYRHRADLSLCYLIFIDVELHMGMHNYPAICVRRRGELFTFSTSLKPLHGFASKLVWMSLEWTPMELWVILCNFLPILKKSSLIKTTDQKLFIFGLESL